MSVKEYVKEFHGLKISIELSEHAIKRVYQRGIGLDYVNNQLGQMAKLDILLDLEMGKRFAILDNKKNIIIVFKVLFNVNSQTDVDLVIITVIKQTKKTYFGINNIPTIDMDRQLISYGFDKHILVKNNKRFTKEKRFMTFGLNEIDNFFRKLKTVAVKSY